MKIEMKPTNAIKKIILSNEHASSSYGIPVAVVDGEAYGPADELPIWPDNALNFLHERAALTILACSVDMNLSESERNFVRLFCDPTIAK